MDWWYDSRLVPAGTVEDLAEQLPGALMALLGEAFAAGTDGEDSEDEDEELALVDLSAPVSDGDE